MGSLRQTPLSSAGQGSQAGTLLLSPSSSKPERRRKRLIEEENEKKEDEDKGSTKHSKKKETTEEEKEEKESKSKSKPNIVSLRAERTNLAGSESGLWRATSASTASLSAPASST